MDKAVNEEGAVKRTDQQHGKNPKSEEAHHYEEISDGQELYGQK